MAQCVYCGGAEYRGHAGGADNADPSERVRKYKFIFVSETCIRVLRGTVLQGKQLALGLRSGDPYVILEVRNLSACGEPLLTTRLAGTKLVTQKSRSEAVKGDKNSRSNPQWLHKFSFDVVDPDTATLDLRVLGDRVIWPV